jgi:peptide/nickel transport system permease protein
MVPKVGTYAVTRHSFACRRVTAIAAAIARLPVVRVVGRRLLMAVPLLLVVSVLSFVLVSLTPGDAARQILGVESTPAQYEQLRHALGLDLPVYKQYWRWVSRAARGNLGVSLFDGERVSNVIVSRLPVTLSLIGGALLMSVIVGVGLGILSAIRAGPIGRLVDALSLIGFALPSFWVAGILIALFAVRLRWFPATGYVQLVQSPAEWARALVLPVIALALNGVAITAKQTREAMLDALSSEYIRVARLNGIREGSIVFRHGLKNSAIRVVTILGLQAVALLGGTVLIESVFALPGLGGAVVSAAVQHDLPMVQGIVMCFTVIVVLINLLIDLLYAVLNPRVRTY